MQLNIFKPHTIFVISLLITCVILVESSMSSDSNEVFLREDFNTLTNWREFNFVLIKRHTTYSVITDGTETYLKAESDDSASGRIFAKTYNIYKYPKARWRWKVDNVYAKGDVTKKAGDDYPVRIVFMFKYEPAGSSIGKRIRYEFAKAIYGVYPPETGLVYIWANKKHETGIVTSPYAPEEKIIIMEQGDDKTGRWIDEEVNVLEDYLRAFGTEPPAEAGLAVMNDSDDTGEKATSFIDYIEIYR